MTRSWEKGENEFTRAAKREAMRTGAAVEDILDRMLKEAKKDKNRAGEAKLIQAQKFVGQRNRRKGRRRS